VLEDAAEAVGTTYKGRPAGTIAPVGVYSFNGNKIITTTGGGMLVAHDPEWVKRARFWSQQARDPGVAYEHTQVGYNYRMSNVLAGIGRGQLEVLDQRVARRREVAFMYRDAFAELGGLTLMPAVRVRPAHQLAERLPGRRRRRSGSTATRSSGRSRRRTSRAARCGSPCTCSPSSRGPSALGGDVAADLFQHGICLPSSTNLSDEDQQRVIVTVRRAARRER
jgi:pyridoxal phosphate-dependent aminotransferase EpsN